MAIDIEKMKAKEKKREFRPFLTIKKPEGKTYFAYRLKFLGEPYEVKSRRWTDPKTDKPKIEMHAEIELLDAVNQTEQTIKIRGEEQKIALKKGSQWRISISKNLGFELDRYKPLKDKVFDIMNRGKPKGKTYYDYVALPFEGTLSLERLLNKL